MCSLSFVQSYVRACGCGREMKEVGEVYLHWANRHDVAAWGGKVERVDFTAKNYLVGQHRILEAVRKVLGVLIMMPHVIIFFQESVGSACSSARCGPHNIRDIAQQGRRNRVGRQNQVDGWIQVALSSIHFELDVGELCGAK